MSVSYLIKNATVVNEGKIFSSDVRIKSGIIEKIAPQISNCGSCIEIDAEGKYLIPGIIDDQVHFREPGLTHKANIYSEAKAGIAGGVTSFMEMPNTNPPALTQQLLEEKYAIASRTSLANYSFYIGASNDNLDEVLKTDPNNVCGVKIFMGSSTGNLLVDNAHALEQLFEKCPMLIATHCEDEGTIRKNIELYKTKFGDEIPAEAHSEIRDAEACYKSSSLAVGLAKKHNTRLHILHISTAKELELFSNKKPLAEKRITAEVCVHHLYFDKSDYERSSNLIKCNPAIKEKENREALMTALIDDTLDIIATDHAPHTWEEKQNKYLQSPSGIPLLQHSLNVMLEFYHSGKITLEKIVEKMCHAPAICFNIKERGFIREGYAADLSLVDLNTEWMVSRQNILYKCGWSPFEGKTFKGKVTHTFVNGNMVYDNGNFNESQKGRRLNFKG